MLDSVSQSAAKLPESCLQLALDLTRWDDAAALVGSLSNVLMRVELGTPLVLAEGLGTIHKLRSLCRQPLVVVADVKICDAGERIAHAALAHGADVVTAVAAVMDDVTWKGILRAVLQHDLRHTGCAPVLLDTIGHSVDLAALSRLATMAADAGVKVDLCIHRPKSGSAGMDELIAPFKTSETPFDRMVIAGKLTPGEVRAALTAGFDTLVVGGAVASAGDPALVWNAFRNEVATALAR